MNVYISRIPVEKKESIIEAVTKIDRLRPMPAPFSYFEVLFEVWNEHIQPHNPQDINCKGCRTDVFSKFKFMVSIWKKEEKSL